MCLKIKYTGREEGVLSMSALLRKDLSPEGEGGTSAVIEE
jgi:hypothetical protein